MKKNAHSLILRIKIAEILIELEKVRSENGGDSHVFQALSKAVWMVKQLEREMEVFPEDVITLGRQSSGYSVLDGRA